MNDIAHFGYTKTKSGIFIKVNGVEFTWGLVEIIRGRISSIPGVPSGFDFKQKNIKISLERDERVVIKRI